MENAEREQALTPQRHRRNVWGATLFILLMLMLVAFLIPAPNPPRGHIMRPPCMSNMKQISLAIMNYEAKRGHFPPAYIADENGKPMHSWRVLILPFLGQEELYKLYDFSEPWNGPHNSQLTKKCPDVFQCPAAHNRNPSAINYVAVVGEATAWPGKKEVRLEDIKDGWPETIMLVEVADSDINWLEPRDITFDEAIPGVKVEREHGIGGNHPGCVVTAFTDGHVATLKDTISPEDLKAMLTIAGGEKIEDGKY
jgi:hypothetical protein